MPSTWVDQHSLVLLGMLFLISKTRPLGWGKCDNPLTHACLLGLVFESWKVWKKSEISSQKQSFEGADLTLLALLKHHGCVEPIRIEQTALAA